MRSFRVPEVFLLVATEDCTGAGDEVGDVEEGRAVFLDDGSGDDVDVKLGGEGAVGGEVFGGLGAEVGEGGGVGDPWDWIR